jgi:protein-L-isoaspartate(D-aspartate) O-methyltransferase
VVAIEIDAVTLGFARENLNRAGYTDVILVHGDGGVGYADHAHYDRICVTAACPMSRRHWSSSSRHGAG